jgi:hypothetical protein
MGSNAQSLLPTAISLMSGSKARWTIVENVDKIKIKDQRFTWLFERHQQNAPGYSNNDAFGKPHVDEWAMSR